MATVLLGNVAPVEAQPGTSATVNDELTNDRVVLEGQTTVVIVTPDVDINGDPVSLDKQLTEIRNAFRVHSASDAAWVEGHDEFFNKAVAQVFNCPVGRRSDWNAPERDPQPSSGVKAPSLVAPVSDVHMDVREA